MALTLNNFSSMLEPGLKHIVARHQPWLALESHYDLAGDRLVISALNLDTKYVSRKSISWLDLQNSRDEAIDLAVNAIYQAVDDVAGGRPVFLPSRRGAVTPALAVTEYDDAMRDIEAMEEITSAGN